MHHVFIHSLYFCFYQSILLPKPDSNHLGSFLRSFNGKYLTCWCFCAKVWLLQRIQVCQNEICPWLVRVSAMFNHPRRQAGCFSNTHLLLAWIVYRKECEHQRAPCPSTFLTTAYARCGHVTDQSSSGYSSVRFSKHALQKEISQMALSPSSLLQTTQLAVKLNISIWNLFVFLCTVDRGGPTSRPALFPRQIDRATWLVPQGEVRSQQQS